MSKSAPYRSAAHLLGLGLVGAALPLWFGRYGLVVFDHSLVVDGAWRVLHGQVPYRDFHTPLGPVTFWIVAAALRIFGPTMAAPLLVASAINGVAAALCGHVVAAEGGRLRGWIAGLITAVWFVAPMSFPWPDTLALFFLLVAFVLCRGVGASRGVGLTCCAAAGCALCLAALCKQNIGAVALPLWLVALAVRRRSALDVAACAGGWFLALAAVLIYFHRVDGLGALYDDLVIRAGHIGRGMDPLQKGGWAAFLSSAPVLAQLILLIGAIALAYANRERRPFAADVDLWVLLVVALWGDFSGAAHHWLFLAYVGLAVVWMDAGYSSLRPEATRGSNLVRWGVVSVLLIGGSAVSARRDCGDYAFRSHGYDFSYRLQSERLWPMRLDATIGPLLDELVVELSAESTGSIMIFPNASVLYMASDRVAPQPFLYFHPGNSFHDDLGDQQELIAAVERTRPARILLLKDLQFPLDDVNHQLSFMPRVAEYLQQCYAAGLSGDHRVWIQRRDVGPCEGYRMSE